jgi:uncharacterized OB-fold protein
MPLTSAFRAARYRPPGNQGGRRREGPDEDALTLALAAVDLLEEEGPLGPAKVEFFGPLPATSVEVLAAALGVDPARVTVHADSEIALGNAVGAAEPGAAGATLWLFAESFQDAGELEPRLRDAGAVAVVGALPRERLAPPSGTDRAESSLGAPGTALRRAAGLAPEGPTPAAPTDPAPAPVPAAPSGSLDQRSEGAYVPRPRYLENLPSRLRFAAERCGACGALTFPLRGYCRACGRADRIERIELDRRGGVVEAITTIHPGAQPTEFDGWVRSRGAYDVALVRLAPGALVTLQVSDASPGALLPGARVDTAIRRLYPMEGEWRYGRKAVPARAAPGRGPV